MPEHEAKRRHLYWEDDEVADPAQPCYFMPSCKSIKADLLIVVQVATLVPQDAAYAEAQRPYSDRSEPDRIQRQHAVAVDEGDGQKGGKQVRPGSVRQQP